MQEIINRYINATLAFAEAYPAYLMYEETPVAASMSVPYDDNKVGDQPLKLMMEHPQADGLLLERITPKQYPWKPVEGTITDTGIREVEQYYNIRLPESYKAYLKYKHFYTVFFQPDIRLYAKPADTWKQRLCEPNDEMQKELLDQGYFAIGDFSDHGAICFKLDDVVAEPRVVMIDYECGAPEDESEEILLGTGFANFLERVLQQGTASVRALKDWEQRLYNR